MADVDERAARRHAMVLVRRTVPLLQEAVERAVILGRADARAASRASLIREISLPQEDESLDALDEDRAAAHTAATSYAGAWGAAVMAVLLMWPHDGTERPPSPSLQEARLRRIAATEVARAFNDERGRLAHRLAKSRNGAAYVKEWSALLDRRTCRHCRACDGQVRELHQSFSRPLPAHPNCRCIAEIWRRY